jgi:ubiquitin-protein ligase
MQYLTLLYFILIFLFFHVVFKYSPEKDVIQHLNVDIIMTEKYPFYHPKIVFLDKINHPCLDPLTGVFNLYSNGSDWSPALTLVTTVISLYSVIYGSDPNFAEAYERTSKFKAELISRTGFPEI